MQINAKLLASAPPSEKSLRVKHRRRTSGTLAKAECRISGRTRKETVRQDGLFGFVSTLRRFLERETGFEPATSCLEGSDAHCAARSGLPATNYRRGRPRL